MGNTANLVLPYPENTDPLANMAAAIQALAEALDSGLVAGSGWTNVTFSGTWVNLGGAWQTMQYKRVGKRVYLRGAVKSGTSGTVAFTLPAGYRPPADVAYGTSSAGGFAQITVASTGAVTLLGATTAFHVNLSFDTV